MKSTQHAFMQTLSSQVLCRKHYISMSLGEYEGGSICNENPFIIPPTHALGIYAICQTKDQCVAVLMVHATLFYLSKFNKLQTF